MSSQIKANLTDKGTWLRLLVMLLFAVIFNVAELVVAVVVIVQFLFKLLTGQANARLRDLGHRLAVYLRQIIEFLTYHSEDKPYPFGEWPAAAAAGSPPVAAKQPPAQAAKAPATRKSSARKKPKSASPAAPKADGGEPAEESPKD